MEEAIRRFPAQFNFDPDIENKEKLKSYDKFVISGMGGSHLGGDIIKHLLPNTPIKIHRNYSLPKTLFEPNTLFIASSFSGNTEETMSFAESVLEKNLPLAIVTKGGKLLNLAKEKNIPFIKFPEVEIQPRMALGFSTIALAKLINKTELLAEFQNLSGKLNMISLEDRGKSLAEEIKNRIPIIYSSERNEFLAQNWKIKFNETGKIPAFFNVFPELNHNEMTGFDFNEKSASLSEKFVLLFLLDSDDNPRVRKRIDITSQLLKNKGITVKKIETEGETRIIKIFNSLILADWTAFYTASIYGHEPEKVPMVEEFKHLMEN